MSNLKSRQKENLRNEVIKTHKYLCNLIENEGWEYDWHTWRNEEMKVCCLAGAWMMANGIDSLSTADMLYDEDSIPIQLSNLANKCRFKKDSSERLLIDDEPPTLVALMDVMNEQ